jgi:hypothetical protein
MMGNTLKDPVFDIHFNPRVEGRDSNQTVTIPYAMVVTVEAPRMPRIYDHVVNRYRAQLQQLRPQVKVAVRA